MNVVKCPLIVCLFWAGFTLFGKNMQFIFITFYSKALSAAEILSQRCVRLGGICLHLLVSWWVQMCDAVLNMFYFHFKCQSSCSIEEDKHMSGEWQGKINLFLFQPSYMLCKLLQNCHKEICLIARLSLVTEMASCAEQGLSICCKVNRYLSPKGQISDLANDNAQ